MRASPAQISIFVVAAIFLLVIFGRIAHEKNYVPDSLVNGFSTALGRQTTQSFMQTSERLWAKTVKERLELRNVIYGQSDVGLFPAQTEQTLAAYPFTIWDMVPASYNCPFEVERIGRMGEGGKWVCGMSRYESAKNPIIMYSMGIQNDTSFEQQMMARTNAELWAYDLSIVDIAPFIHPAFRPRVHYQQIGIAGVTNPHNVPPYFSIIDLMAQNGHTYIDILKIDVEYAEFQALSTFELATRQPNMEFPIGQIIIEIHLFHGDGTTVNGPLFLDWWASFEARGMRPTWAEPNLLTVTMKSEDEMPRLAKYSWINVLDTRSKLWRNI
ncbi:hypothetical protein BP5796_01789 [Coleophoma crateriformis]|uniref:Methyltransferase domain-containing protein n=1 Tax=Coleophoma crateriformis TaxID=565419 RepID=A0A3D8T1E4_9HELO|nr:hypothetical protein BP5796_01789 [Coleophoma crateriformis]